MRPSTAIRFPATEPPQAADDLRRHRRFSLVVDVDQRFDQPDRRFGVGGELGQRQRILGKARTAEARAGIEKLAADAVVETDAVGDVENIGAETLAQVGDFVDEGHLHRQEHVGRIFDHLRAATRRIDDPPAVAFDGPVDLPHHLARAVVLDPDDDSVGPLEVLDRRAFAQEFWIRDDGERTLRRVLGDDALDLVACADRDRRLNHDNGEVFDNLADSASRVVNEMHVGRADLRQRRRADGDEDRLRPAPGLFQAGREREPARSLIGEHQLAQARLVDRNATLSQTCDFALVDLDADDLVAKIGQTGPRNEADIARANHHNAHRMNPRPIAASISAARAALAARLPKRFPPDVRIEGSTRRFNRHGPLGPRSGAEFACRSRATQGPSTGGAASD